MKEVSTDAPESGAVELPVVNDELLPAADQPEETLPATVEDVPVRLPGSLLREAREARGVSVFEVAQSLKFGVRQIEALEADNYAVLPAGATFQRGFVRGYAKLLKLDPEPLLGMLDARAPAVLPDVREPQNMGVAQTPATSGRRTSMPMIVGSAALAIIALGFAAWQFLGESRPGVKPQSNVAEGSAAAIQPPEIRVEETPASAPAGSTGTALNPADLRQLVFVFPDKSWVEVTDASQRVILSGENLPGTRQAISGKPPFQVVIGNANRVELQYGDRQIDLKPYIRAEVARLTLE